MSAKRLLATESLDPNGPMPLWITPAIRRLGWQAWTLPAYEAVHALGPSAYTAAVVRIADELRPHVLLVHPPYDHLHAEACRRIRACGTRIIGLAYDDPLYYETWGEAELRDLRQRFDLWATTAAEGPTVEAGARPVLWVMAPESVAVDDPSAPEVQVVMIGRCTDLRQATARAVADAGIQIACFGSGWATGPVTRPSRLGLMRRAKAVITPSDGASSAPLHMIEAALIGARQIVEDSPGLERYLPGDGAPATYGTPEECARRLAGDEPLPAWTGVPTWEEQWPELIADLALADQPERTRSPALEQLYASLAHIDEQGGRMLAAVAALKAWGQAAPDDPGPKLGLARCAHAGRDWERVVRLTTEAEQALESRVARAVVDLRRFVADQGRGRGLGLSGALDPGLDMAALRLHALIRDERSHEALEEVEAMSAARRRAVLAAFYPDVNAPGTDEVLKALAETPTDVTPVTSEVKGFVSQPGGPRQDSD